MPMIRIIVAAHTPYPMPKDPMYLPLRVGRGGKALPGWAEDSTGDNISDKNPRYCELTGLYWAWKNLDDADYIGLAHYRRHFTARRGRADMRRALTGEQAEEALRNADVLLPSPRHYWIETNYSQYAHAHHAVDLDTARTVLQEKYPAYLPAFEACMRRTWGHRFNMFIMRRDLLDRYCAWLFDILFELERRLDISGYSPNDQRVFGFVGERLLDVWIEAEGIPYRDVPYMFLERQNWLVKGGRFLLRKFQYNRIRAGA